MCVIVFLLREQNSKTLAGINYIIIVKPLDLFIENFVILITTKTDKVNHSHRKDFRLIPRSGLCQFY